MGVWYFQRPGTEAFLAHTGITFPIGRPLSMGAAMLRNISEQGISWFPYEVLIDPQGRIAHYTPEYDATQLGEAIERAMKSTP